MTAIFATLAGARVLDARVTLPAWGCWYAEVTTEGEHTLSGAVELVVADLKLKGTVLSGGPSKGRSAFRVVAGGGGWGKKLAAQSYADDASVKASKVLGDAARSVGEVLDDSTVPSTMRLGPHWTRNADDPASRLLELVAPQGWYVGEDGITRLGRRARKAFADAAPRVVPLDRALGTVTIASDAIATLVPGIVVDELEAVDVEHELSRKGGLRSTIWGAQAVGTSRLLASFQSIFEQLDPHRKYRSKWEYRVVTREGKRLNVQPVRVSTGMPVLRRVPVRAGVPGCDGTEPALGSRVVVEFLNEDPGRPVVSGFEDAESEGFEPENLTIAVETQLRLGSDSASSAVAKAGPISTWAALVVTAVNSLNPPSGTLLALVSPASSKVRVD